MAIPRKKHYTAEEFFELIPETNERCELINGEIVYQASPNTVHQRLVRKMLTKISNFIEQKGGSCEPFVSPFDVKLSSDTVVQPDIFIVCDPDKVDDKRCNGAPDLVVEVVSSNRNDDYSRKLKIYKEHGVREYWIIDPYSERTVVYQFEEIISINIYTFDQVIPMGIYDGELTITVEELL